jgi:hypothetical protein
LPEIPTDFEKLEFTFHSFSLDRGTKIFFSKLEILRASRYPVPLQLRTPQKKKALRAIAFVRRLAR